MEVNDTLSLRICLMIISYQNFKSLYGRCELHISKHKKNQITRPRNCIQESDGYTNERDVTSSMLSTGIHAADSF